MIPELPPPLIAALADTPLVLALLWMMVLLRRDLAAKPELPPVLHAAPTDRAREELAAFKLEVARTYVPLSLIRDLDHRITQQLARLESKLDEVSRAATAAAAVTAQAFPSRRISIGLQAREPEA